MRGSATPIGRVVTSVNEPSLILAGAKILTLLTDIVKGKDVEGNTEELVKWVDMADLPIEVGEMIQKYQAQHGG